MFWIQIKELSPASRLRYAALVAAMAVRDDELVVATMRELGLRVENCSEEFEVCLCPQLSQIHQLHHCMQPARCLHVQAVNTQLCMLSAGAGPGYLHLVVTI